MKKTGKMEEKKKLPGLTQKVREMEFESSMATLTPILP